MVLSRRAFLKKVGLTTLVSFVGSKMATANMPAPSVLDPKNSQFFEKNTRLITVGYDGDLFKGERSYDTKYKQSVLTEVDLKTGDIKQTLSPIPRGHHVLPMPKHDKLLVCPGWSNILALHDMDHGLIERFGAPKDHVFGGHGVVYDEKGLVFVSLSHVDQKSQSGKIAIFDQKDFKLLDIIETKGSKAHDMTILPDRKTLVVGNYGVKNEEWEQGIARDHYSKEECSSLSFINAETLKVESVSHFEDMKGLAHLGTGRDDEIVIVFERFMEYKDSHLSDEERDNALKKIMKDQVWSLHNEEKTDDKGVSIPTKIRRFNPNTGESHDHFTNMIDQRRPQSIAYNSMTDSLLVCHVYPNTLISVDKTGTSKVFPSKDFGIKEPIGACEIEGTPYIAISGMSRDITLIDTRDMTPALQVPCELFRCSHMNNYTV